MSNKLLCRPGVSKLINMISHHHTRITRFNALNRFRVDCVIRWNQTWKEDPSPLCREGGGIGWLSAKSPKLYTPSCSWNGWRTADWIAEVYDHCHVAHMPAMGKLNRVTMMPAPMVDPPKVSKACSMVPETERIQQDRHQTYKNTKWWEAQLWKRNLPAEYPWHKWYNPEEASEMEIAAVAQWQGQQHLQSALVSVVVAEPQHADMMSLEAPSKRGPW